MAKLDTYLIANPTREELEVGGVKLPPGHVISLTIDTEPAGAAGALRLSEWVSKGCCVAPGAVKNANGEYKGKIASLTDLIEQGSSLLHKMSRPVISAGTDTQAAKGL